MPNFNLHKFSINPTLISKTHLAVFNDYYWILYWNKANQTLLSHIKASEGWWRHTRLVLMLWVPGCRKKVLIPLKYFCFSLTVVFLRLTDLWKSNVINLDYLWLSSVIEITFHIWHNLLIKQKLIFENNIGHIFQRNAALF